MRLVFLGDLNVDRPHAVGDESCIWLTPQSYVLANLEGPICVSNSANAGHGSGLNNTRDVLAFLDTFRVKAVSLANNHIYDFPDAARSTPSILAENGIRSFGVGWSLEEAARPLCLDVGNTSIKVFAFGWDVIGCRYASASSAGVNPLNPDHLRETLRELRRHDERTLVVFVLHWNYELELYPQPAHRQLAMDLVKAGVDVIIGLHPHVAQGAELVNGKPIIYSLGNWFFPPRHVGRLHLRFPAVSYRQLAVEITADGRNIRDVRFHWHLFNPDLATIAFEKTEGWEGEQLEELTPFAGMRHEDYVSWFRKHRTRRSLLPLYTNYQDSLVNAMNDRYVKLRHRAIELAVRLRLKNKIG